VAAIQQIITIRNCRIPRLKESGIPWKPCFWAKFRLLKKIFKNPKKTIYILRLRIAFIYELANMQKNT